MSWRDRIRRWWVPAAVLVLGLAADIAVTIQLSRLVETEARQRFDSSVQQRLDGIGDRLLAYVYLLRSGAALFAASERVERHEFREFVKRLQLESSYPGVQGIGFSRRIDAAALGDVVADEQAGAPGFRVWPEQPRDEYHAILYLEPLDRRNQAAIGYDMYTDATRRAAMARARDSGTPAASGRVTLVQEIDEQKQAGFLIYMPVYVGGAVPDSIAARRERLLGFVYSPFRAGDLFRGVFGGDPAPPVGFAVYDTASASPDDLLYASGSPGERTPSFTQTRRLDVAGRTWTFEFFSTPDFEQRAARDLVALVFAGGVIASLLLAGLTWQQTRARLRTQRSEARHRAVTDTALDCIVGMGDDGLVTEFNPAAQRLFGYSREQALGRSLGDLIVPPELRDAHRVGLERYLATRVSRVQGQRIELPAVRSNGERLLVELSIMRNEGDTPGFTGFLRDVTERRRAEAERDQLLERERVARTEAEQANRLKDEFLATVSHELRTPLSAILGWSQLLERGRGRPDLIADGVSAITRNARTQARLIDDLLDLSRIASGKFGLDLQPVEARAVVAAALESVAPVAQAKGVALEHRLGDTGTIVADPVRLQQVVWNLLTNAIKFTAAGGRVQVESTGTDDGIEIAVADTGQGIAADFLPHIFERFRQADSSTTRRHGGLGIGLALVRQIVEHHGGGVEAESAGLGHGARFVIRLPRVATAAAGDPAVDDAARGDPTRRGPAAAPAVSLEGVHVLVVDDDADVRAVVQRTLHSAGARVSVAADALDAIAALRGSRPDVLVSDIGMPNHDGCELIEWVRALPDEALAQTPAAALSAMAAAADRERALASGYDTYLVKPVESAALLSVVAQLAAAGAVLSRPAPASPR